MKHLFICLVLATSLFTANIIANDYQITFENENGQQPDSVWVENLSTGETIMLKGSDILQLSTNTTGVAGTQYSTLPLSLSPNPTQNNTQLGFYNAQAGQVNIAVYNMAGQTILSQNSHLAMGNHTFRLSGLSAGSYLVSVATANGNNAQMLISSAYGANTPTISYIGNIYSSNTSANQTNTIAIKNASLTTANTVQMQYTNGQKLRVVAYSGSQTASIQLNPTTDYTVRFSNYNNIESGVYLGIIGFNETTTERDLSGPRYIEDKEEYLTFVDNLQIGANTILYHSVDKAIDVLAQAELPSDLGNVSIVTFTDGLDQGSWVLHINEYANEAAMLTAVNQRISNESVNGLNLSAYTIGIRGTDITNVTQFSENLNKLASKSDNVYEANDMDGVNTTFQNLAESLNQTNASHKHTISVNIPGKSPGVKVRIVFNGSSTEPDASQYIEGTYAYTDNTFSLSNVTYHGLKSSSGSKVTGTQNGINVLFVFKDVETDNGEMIESNNIKQWAYENSVWQINSEFNPGQDTQTQTETIRSSAAIILVLDCSSSLGSDFSKMKTAAKNFINELLDGAGNTPIPPTIQTKNATNITYKSATLVGEISNQGDYTLTELGFRYSTNSDFTAESTVSIQVDTEGGGFTHVLNDIRPEKKYYYRVYAKAENKEFYGNTIDFTTKVRVAPILQTYNVADITYNSVTLQGNVSNQGEYDLIELGFQYSSNSDFTAESTVSVQVDSTLGSFNYILNNLSPETKYYYRSYAKVGNNEIYGGTRGFTTKVRVAPTLQTYSATDITYSSVTLQGNVSNQGDYILTEFGFQYSTNSDFTTESTVSIQVDTELGSFTHVLNDLNPEIEYYYRAYAIAAENKEFYGDKVSFIAYGTMQDIDGNTYKTVRIGDQTWMAENLKVTIYANGTGIPHVTDDTAWGNLGDNDTDKAHCYYNNDTGLGYGALYTYAAATNGDNSGTNVQGVCPTAWHLPSDTEWTELENYLADNGYNYDGSTGGGANKIAKAMASQTGWYSSDDEGDIGRNPSINNSSGFTALTGGYRSYRNGTFGTAGFHGHWWSSTQNDSSRAFLRYLYYGSSVVSRSNYPKSYGFSVRCVRD